MKDLTTKQPQAIHQLQVGMPRDVIVTLITFIISCVLIVALLFGRQVGNVLLFRISLTILCFQIYVVNKYVLFFFLRFLQCEGEHIFLFSLLLV